MTFMKFNHQNICVSNDQTHAVIKKPAMFVTVTMLINSVQICLVHCTILPCLLKNCNRYVKNPHWRFEDFMKDVIIFLRQIVLILLNCMRY